MLFNNSLDKHQTNKQSSLFYTCRIASKAKAQSLEVSRYKCVVQCTVSVIGGPGIIHSFAAFRSTIGSAKSQAIIRRIVKLLLLIPSNVVLRLNHEFPASKPFPSNNKGSLAG